MSPDKAATVDEFVATKVLPQFHPVVALIRQLVQEEAPGTVEAIAYGVPTFRGRAMLAVISPTKKDITFSFSRGNEFEDPFGLLAGVGKVSKHVKLTTVETAPMEALRHYIRQAIALDQAG